MKLLAAALFLALSSSVLNTARAIEPSTDELGKKAESLREKGQYPAAAKLYRTIAKRLQGQESDDGQSLSAWSEADARVCECLEKRAMLEKRKVLEKPPVSEKHPDQKAQPDADRFLSTIQAAIASRKNPAALFACDVLVGSWEAEFGPPEGPDAVAKRLFPLLSKVTKSARLGDSMLVGITEKTPSGLTVFEAQKGKEGWLVHKVLQSGLSDFEAIRAQELPGTKSAVF